jgi:hypothetical protein
MVSFIFEKRAGYTHWKIHDVLTFSLRYALYLKTPVSKALPSDGTGKVHPHTYPMYL